MSDSIEYYSGDERFPFSGIAEVTREDKLALIAWSRVEIPDRPYDGLIRKMFGIDLRQRRSQKIYDGFRDTLNRFGVTIVDPIGSLAERGGE